MAIFLVMTSACAWPRDGAAPQSIPSRDDRHVAVCPSASPVVRPVRTLGA